MMVTRLTLRAVHIETADSLETDSYINTIRRFVSRRGQVTILRSYAANFVGAEKEMREAIQHLDSDKTERTLLPKGITVQQLPTRAGSGIFFFFPQVQHFEDFHLNRIQLYHYKPCS